MGRNGTKLGQNFLVDDAACLRIAESLGDLTGRTVVEIGPGHGAITAHLAHQNPSCAHLHLLEFDPALAREIAFRFRNDPHVTVHHADVLKTDLSTLLPLPPTNPSPGIGEEHRPTLDLIGNLPYYITSDILLHLFSAARAGFARRAVLMTQREVAQRIAAPPGSSEYGALSAITQLHATVTELFTLPPGAFLPPPDVHSTVFRLDFAPRFDELGIPFEGFNRFLRATFAQKRKTLANNLRSAGYLSTQLTAAWPVDLPPQVRAEAVTLEQLTALYRGLDCGLEDRAPQATPSAA